MRRWMSSFLFLGMIILSVSIVTAGIVRQKLGGCCLEDILKANFIYYSKSDSFYSSLNAVHILCYFGSLLFGYLFLSQGFWEASEKYRKMLIIRFQKKQTFFLKFVISGAVKSLLITGVIGISLWLSPYLYRKNFIYSDIQFIHFVLRMGNVLLFFNIMTIITFGGNVFLDGGRTLLLSGAVIGILLMMDICLPAISIVTYGESLKTEMISMVIQAIVYVAFLGFMNQSLKIVEW